MQCRVISFWSLISYHHRVMLLSALTALFFVCREGNGLTGWACTSALDHRRMAGACVSTMPHLSQNLHLKGQMRLQQKFQTTHRLLCSPLWHRHPLLLLSFNQNPHQSYNHQGLELQLFRPSHQIPNPRRGHHPSLLLGRMHMRHNSSRLQCSRPSQLNHQLPLSLLLRSLSIWQPLPLQRSHMQSFWHRSTIARMVKQGVISSRIQTTQTAQLGAWYLQARAVLAHPPHSLTLRCRLLHAALYACSQFVSPLRYWMARALRHRSWYLAICATVGPSWMARSQQLYQLWTSLPDFNPTSTQWITGCHSSWPSKMSRAALRRRLQSPGILARHHSTLHRPAAATTTENPTRQGQGSTSTNHTMTCPRKRGGPCPCAWPKSSISTTSTSVAWSRAWDPTGGRTRKSPGWQLSQKRTGLSTRWCSLGSANLCTDHNDLIQGWRN